MLVDYNQNAWGRTLASIYSVRPKPRATVSTPVTWEEVERGIAIEDFRMDNVPARVAEARRPLEAAPRAEGPLPPGEVPVRRRTPLDAPASRVYFSSGFSQRRPEKREKSRSALQSVKPCSMASAAR